jgi:two-component system, LuxR family, sensor kinase FixL
MRSILLRAGRTQLLVAAGAMIVTIALIDWRVDLNVSFGFLYLFPMLIVGYYLPPWQIAIVAGICTLLAEWFDPFAWQLADGIPRDLFMLGAFWGVGLFAYQSAKNRKLVSHHVREVEQEVESRRDAEQQLEVLIESSPAAILTVDPGGKILMANHAAHCLLGFETDTLRGEPIKAFLPPLANVPYADQLTPTFRTVMQCYGRRHNGEVFLADVWFSTYHTRSGTRLAAMVVDSSEELREREEFSLHQLLAGSRLIVGAVSHEVRNACGAISVVYANLSRSRDLAQNEDFRALGDLVEGLARVATLELRQTTGAPEINGVDLQSVLDELRIVIEPTFRESGIIIRWQLPDVLPAVWADRQNLLQVFLNLTKNSERAMRNQERKELTVNVTVSGRRVIVRIRDTGIGVSAPERLFRPFQRGAEATGLGLYLSRAFVKAFKGDLRHEAGPTGSCFAVDLALFADQETESETAQMNGQDPDIANKRSCAVSRGSEPAH